MPRISIVARVLVPALTLVALLGCATAPVQEMSDARQAIAAAEEAGAAELALDVLVAAREALEDAQQNLQRGSYGLARTHALSAKNKAVEALAVSKGGLADP
jgi:hypothetical protein